MNKSLCTVHTRSVQKSFEYLSSPFWYPAGDREMAGGVFFRPQKKRSPQRWQRFGALCRVLRAFIRKNKKVVAYKKGLCKRITCCSHRIHGRISFQADRRGPSSLRGRWGGIWNRRFPRKGLSLIHIWNASLPFPQTAGQCPDCPLSANRKCGRRQNPFPCLQACPADTQEYPPPGIPEYRRAFR